MTNPSNRVLTPRQVRKIRMFVREGLGRKRIARAMGISQWTAQDVIDGKNYRWVK